MSEESLPPRSLQGPLSLDIISVRLRSSVVQPTGPENKKARRISCGRALKVAVNSDQEPS
jgi:hypothetical protein